MPLAMVGRMTKGRGKEKNLRYGLLLNDAVSDLQGC